ncbi:hypothetical protein [Streptomyces sp. NPDC088400]|uniref:hypothetical protein n=1 Tax=Streptomyces sp. NPDC088400 TaxID=3365861 RepID=UPI0037F5568B
MTSTEQPHESTAGADSTVGAGIPRRRRTAFAVATVAAAVLIAGGGGAYFATSAAGGSGTDNGSGGSSGNGRGTAGGDGQPSLLALDSAATGPGGAPGTGPADGTGASAPPGIAPGEPDPHGIVYRLKGKPPKAPDAARVYRTDGNAKVTAAEVARLAEALGVTGTPRSEETAWKVGTEKDGSGPVLRVTKQAPATWTFARFGPSGGDNCLKGKSCPSGGGSGKGSDLGTGGGSGEDSAVSEAAAKKAAAPVLKALGQDDAALDARQVMGAVRVVSADPVVGGLPTYGWSTGIQVGADGQVVGGIGHLKAPERSDSYPVIGADEALKELNKPAEGGTARKPVEIKKAVFGLAMRSVAGREALVPSWLFEVAPGGEAPPYTVTQPAVAPEFLTKPKPTNPTPTNPKPPREERPRGNGDKGIRVTSYGVDGRTLSLRFMGGVCSTYKAKADESGTAVKVKLTVSEPEPGKVCVAMAKEQDVTVTLDKALGERQVVDGASGERVPRN